jgi:hypothetical protein
MSCFTAVAAAPESEVPDHIVSIIVVVDVAATDAANTDSGCVWKMRYS